MIIGAPGSSLVTVEESGNGVFRGRDKVVNDGEYFAGYVDGAGAAGEYGHAQLKNPTGSGVTVIIDGLMIKMDDAARVNFAFYDTDLTTLAGTWDVQHTTGGTGVAQLRSESNVSPLGGSFWSMETGSPGEGQNIVFPWGIQLAEGEGFLLRCQNVADDVEAYIYGRQV
tara:strand:+ start:1783 stop:2289 length:507 start_codon:yes stop_codon:yes gene_type:complete